MILAIVFVLLLCAIMNYNFVTFDYNNFIIRVPNIIKYFLFNTAKELYLLG